MQERGRSEGTAGWKRGTETEGGPGEAGGRERRSQVGRELWGAERREEEWGGEGRGGGEGPEGQAGGEESGEGDGAGTARAGGGAGRERSRRRAER